MKNSLVIILLLLSYLGISQETPIHITGTGVYDFIDEMSMMRIIDVNNSVKPYSDKIVYNYLVEVNEHSIEKLNKRQRKELEFYLDEFSYNGDDDSFRTSNLRIENFANKYNLSLLPPEFRYKKASFYMNVRPIWGINYYTNQKGTNFHRWGGGSFNMHIGSHFSAFASVRDNNVSEILAKKEFLTQLQGGTYKGRKDGGGDYSEMRGGLSYSWDWGSVSMVKNHVDWGTNYHGANIISSRAPSIAQVKFHLKPVKWFEFNYLHGWLVSNVIDSTRSYTTANGLRRDVMHPKYIAANLFTVTPFDDIHFSFGNSIIYSDMNPHPGYLIPFMFFKSVDHWLNSTDHIGSYVGQNSQMFVNLSILRLKHFHFYGDLFLDELKAERIGDPDKHNFWGYKIGVKNSNGLLSNLSLGIEYTRTSPNTYEHNISTTTFESNGYNLGHYLRSNSDELYFSIGYKPISKLKVKAEYIHARHGSSVDYVSGGDAITIPFMDTVKWDNEMFNIIISYEFAYNSYINASYNYNSSSGEDILIFSPEFYQGNNQTFSFGFNIGF